MEQNSKLILMCYYVRFLLLLVRHLLLLAWHLLLLIAKRNFDTKPQHQTVAAA